MIKLLEPNPETKRSPGLSGWTQSDHKDPYKKKAGGSEWQQMEVGQCRQEDWKVLPCWLGDGDGPWTKDCRAFRSCKKPKSIDYFLEPPREHCLTDTDLRCSDLLNCKIINSCCLRSLGLWLFVTTTKGNKYRSSVRKYRRLKPTAHAESEASCSAPNHAKMQVFGEDNRCQMCVLRIITSTTDSLW